MGPQAKSFFYKTKLTVRVEDKKKLSSFSKAGLVAYQQCHNNDKCKGLFQKANNGWHLTNKDRWFGSTYQTICPSTWGTQYLHTNLNQAITKHGHESISRINKTNTNEAETKIYKIIGKQALAIFSNRRPSQMINKTRKDKCNKPKINKKRINEYESVYGKFTHCLSFNST